MHHQCSSCQSAPATVQILDLENTAIVKNKFLCDACANSSLAATGGDPSAAKLQMQFSAEILESLIGSKDEADAAGLDVSGSARCPACEMTTAEFRMRGRLGCPRCYETFREPLMTVLDRVHDATCHRGRFPGPTRAALPADAAPVGDDAPQESGASERDEARAKIPWLEKQLQVAVDEERYEDAAQLRDELDRARRLSDEASS